jgi:two-component system chemotaxis response regulator CheY
MSRTGSKHTRNQGTILVIETEMNVRNLIRLTLTKAGYEVLEAPEGAGAIELLASEDQKSRADAIICDIRMPRVNGLEPVSQLCRCFPSSTVMVLTGYPDTRLAISLLKQGVLYIPKPLDTDKLLTFVGRAMERRRS